MRIALATATLKHALARIERVVPSASSNTRQTHVTLAFAPDRLTLTGTSTDLDIRIELEGECSATGAIDVRANVLNNVARALPSDIVTLEAKDEELHLTSGKYSTSVRLAQHDPSHTITFPEPTQFTGEIDADALATVLEHARYATANKDYQAVFRHLRLEMRPNHLRAVGTDGFRLASHHTTHDTNLHADILIPHAAIDELLKNLTPGTARLAINDNHTALSITTGNATLTLKLGDGIYPDYERTIPSTYALTAQLDASALARAIKRVAVMSDASANQRVDLTIEEGAMRIESSGPFGSASETLALDEQTGTEASMRAAFNAAFLVDAVNRAAGAVQLRFTGATTPTMIAAPDNDAYLALVVPLRLT